MACQSAIKKIYRNISLLNVRLPGLLPRVECIPALIACIAMDKASSIYSLVLAMFWGGSASVKSVLWQGVILHAEFVKQTSKQANRQTTNITCVFGLRPWLGFLTWNLGLGSWLGTLAWVLDLGPWLQTDMVFYELDLSMVRLTYFSDRSHNWDCRLVDVDLYDSISLSSIIDEYNDSLSLSLSELLMTLAAFFPTKGELSTLHESLEKVSTMALCGHLICVILAHIHQHRRSSGDVTGISHQH